MRRHATSEVLVSSVALLSRRLCSQRDVTAKYNVGMWARRSERESKFFSAKTPAGDTARRGPSGRTQSAKQTDEG